VRVENQANCVAKHSPCLRVMRRYMRDNPRAAISVVSSCSLPDGTELTESETLREVLSDGALVQARDMGGDSSDDEGDNGKSLHNGKRVRVPGGDDEHKGPEGFHVFITNVEGRRRFIDRLDRDTVRWCDLQKRIVKMELGRPNSGYTAMLYSEHGAPLIARDQDLMDTLADWEVKQAEEFWTVVCPKVGVTLGISRQPAFVVAHTCLGFLVLRTTPQRMKGLTQQWALCKSLRRALRARPTQSTWILTTTPCTR